MLLTHSDLADLERVSEIRIRNSTGLQHVAARWVYHRTDKGDRDHYMRRAEAMIKTLDRALQRIDDTPETVAEARFAADLLSPHDGQQHSAADQIRGAKLQIEFLLARENGDQAWFDRTVKLLLLTLLLVEYYRIGGKETLPANDIEVPDDTNNVQFRFVSTFIAILHRHLKKKSNDPEKHFVGRLIVVDDLKRSKAGTLVDLLREAKINALDVQKMHYGYEIRDTKIIALDFDPLIDTEFPFLDLE